MQFHTGVQESRAILPAPPTFWSYSALTEIEACPRRYMLSRASYPDLWEGQGYPRIPSLSALFGDVVHGALDVIVTALVDAGCNSPQDAAAVSVLRELGGYTAVTDRAVDDRLTRLPTNPRLDADQRRRLVRDLRGRVAEARAEIQAYVSRTNFLSSASGTASGALGADAGEDSRTGLAFPRRPAEPGAHAEVLLAAEELRLMGRIDFLSVTSDRVDIIDYKTGTEDEGHLDQLRLYALLWDLDRIVNPRRRLASEITAAYPSRNVTIPGPSESALRELEFSFKQRIASADAEVQALVPRAIPEDKRCSTCQVRQLCDVYWSQMAPDPASLADGAWFDYQGVVGSQNGSRSWWMLHEGSGQRQLLLRTTATAPPLTQGSRIRVLGVRLDDDPEIDATAAVMTAWSEVFILASDDNEEV